MSARFNKHKLAHDWHLYRQLYEYISNDWRRLVLALLASATYAGIDAWFVYFLQPLLNKGLIAKDVGFLTWAPILVLVVFGVRGLTNCVANYNLALVSRNLILRLRQNMFAHLQQLPATFYDRHSAGSISALLLYNVEQVANASADALTTIIQASLLIISLIVLMFGINWQLALLYLIMAPITAILMRAMSVRVRKLSVGIQDSMANLNSIIEENVLGYKTIRACGGRDQEQTRFNHAIAHNKRRELQVVLARGISIAIVQVIAAIGVALTLYLATCGHYSLSPGGFVAMVAAMLAIIKPLKDLAQVHNKLHRGLAGAQSAFALLAEPPEDDRGEYAPARVEGRIVFDQVSFAYINRTDKVLDKINITIAAGTCVAIVGRSGSGKSTLVSLLSRFYTDYQGQILLDDQPLNTYQLDKLRSYFAVVAQEVFLANDTVARNIAYGTHDLSESALRAAADAAYVTEFVHKLPQGFDTIIGANGVLLSGGQRQRVAIARAFLKNAPIIILDEATSALDAEAEQEVQLALQRLTAGRTTIVIAHKLTTIEHADQIIVLDHGHLVGVGRHQDLLASNNYYKKLCKWQLNKH